MNSSSENEWVQSMNELKKTSLMKVMEIEK